MVGVKRFQKSDELKSGAGEQFNWWDLFKNLFLKKFEFYGSEIHVNIGIYMNTHWQLK